MTRDELAALDERAKSHGYYTGFEDALVNLYRTGQLVMVPSVEDVADAVWRITGDLLGEPVTSADAEGIATAVLTSMGAKTDAG